MRKKPGQEQEKKPRNPLRYTQRKRKETLNVARIIKERTVDLAKETLNSYWRMSNPGGNPGAVLRGCKSETPDRSGRMGGGGIGGRGMVQRGGGGELFCTGKSIGLVLPFRVSHLLPGTDT